ncbi:MAG: hypothetical protein PVI71_13050, partial [Desulfobacterales bacterium]
PLPDDSAARLYESYIDKYISACNLKERLLKDSRFQHIRKKATLAMKKATFFKVNKERLVAEMIQAKIAKKYHHIDAYLNQQFLESLLKDSRMAHRRATRHR